MHSTPQCLSQLHANIGAFGKGIGRVVPVHDGVKAGLRIAQGFGVAVDIELVGVHGIKHHLRHLRGTDLAAADRLVAHGLADELALA